MVEPTVDKREHLKVAWKEHYSAAEMADYSANK